MSADARDAKPSHDHIPKPFGEATMGEEVSLRLKSLLAKRANTAIFPTFLLEAVRRSKPTMDGKPIKKK